MNILIIFGVIIATVVVIAVSAHNRLVTLRNRYHNAYAQIDVQLRRRHDLIPNLVETVKGYMQHERETLEAVIRARNSAVTASRRAAQAPGDPRAIEQVAAAEAALGGSLNNLFALSEAYPDLKAEQSMTQLTEELRSTENRIAYARQAFNDGVTFYNTQREVFPSNIIAGMFNFLPAQLLEIATPEMQDAPKIAF